MTSPPHYRWRAAETLKQAEQAAATRELAEARRALEHALLEVAEAQRALGEHAARAPGEHALCEPGAARALDLQRAAEFARRHADGERALRAQLERARARAAALQSAVVAQQAALGNARAGQRALERDRERFEHEQRKRSEHREQSEIEEDLRNRRGRNPG